MKRIVLLMVLGVSGLLLAGCNSLPTDIVDQTTTQICREDPNNEACDIDALDDVEDVIAEALVLEAIVVLNNASAETCETVFSVTHEEVLNACENNELLPDNFESFSIISYDKEDSTYVFNGEVDEDTFYQVRIQIGEVDGEKRIISFEAVSIDDPREVDITLEEFEMLVNAYFKDYLDNSVTTSDLADTYFGVELGSRFTMQRANDLSMGISLTFISASMLEDTLFELTYEETKEGETTTRVSAIRTEQFNNKHRLFNVSDEDCDDDGVVACPSDELLSKEDITIFANTYYQDYLDSTVSDQAFADMYMGGELEDSWAEVRRRHITNDITITLKDIVLNDNNQFAAEIEYQDGDDVTVRKRPGRRKYGDITLKKGYVWVEDIDPTILINEDIAYSLITNFISDFQNLDITNEALVRMYFGGDLDGDGLEDLVLTREEEVANGLTIEVDTNIPYKIFGVFPARITLSSNNETETNDLVFFIKELDKASPYIYKIGDEDFLDCDDDGDSLPTCTIDESLDSDELTTFIEDYYKAYLNPDISDEAFIGEYNGTEHTDSWSQTRLYHITNDVSITIKNMYFNDQNAFLVEVEYQDGDDLTLRKRPGRKKYGDITLKKGYILGGDIDPALVVDEAYAKSFIEDFFDDFQDLDITNQALIRMYFGGDLDGDGLDDLLLTREEEITNGLTIEVDTDTPYDTFGAFHVTITLSSNDQEETKELVFFIKQLDKASPYIYKIGDEEDLDCNDVDDALYTCTIDESLDQDDVTRFVQDYYKDYLDSDITNQAFATLYMDGVVEDRWAEIRQAYITNDVTITIKHIYFDDNNAFVAEIEYQDGDDLTIRKRPGRAKYGDITLKKAYLWLDDIESPTVTDEDNTN